MSSKFKPFWTGLLWLGDSVFFFFFKVRFVVFHAQRDVVLLTVLSCMRDAFRSTLQTEVSPSSNIFLDPSQGNWDQFCLFFCSWLRWSLQTDSLVVRNYNQCLPTQTRVKSRVLTSNRTFWFSTVRTLSRAVNFETKQKHIKHLKPCSTFRWNILFIY